MNKNIKLIFALINIIFFIIGMIQVWNLSHNWTIMFWAFIAALHFVPKEES